jgi:hypothetical protein
VGSVASNPSRSLTADDIVRAAGTLLGVGTIAVVGLVTVGTLLTLAAGKRPMIDPGPPFDPALLFPNVLALRPEGFLWLGLVLTVMLPAARVLLSLLGFTRVRDLRAAGIALAVLCVLALSVAIGLFSSTL